MENKLDRNSLIYKIGTYDFQKFKTVKSFGSEIYKNDLSLNDAIQEQIRLKNYIDIFKQFTKPNETVKKEKKTLTQKMGNEQNTKSS